jgi:hypothetical protein
VSSHNNLSSVTKTLANRIWEGIKDDKQLSKIIKSQEQISFQSPQEIQAKSAQLSVFLYNVTELASMRNQPQPQNRGEPRTLLYLSLSYLITPLTQNVEYDQILLGKVMQLFAETPVLRGSILQGSLKETGDEIRIMLDELTLDELHKLWTMSQAPYKLCVGYTVRPVRIESVKPEQRVVEKSPQLVVKSKVSNKKA